MNVVRSLNALADSIDPSLAFWSVLLRGGKTWSERRLVAGKNGLRRLDWALDLVSTGDIHKIKELILHCPDKRTAVLEITPDMPAFQFKTKSLNVLGSGGSDLEYLVIGRVIDKATGRCECFAWDYRPTPGQAQLVAYKSTVYNFGAWRETTTRLGALSLEVQGMRL
jgi:hypothetical protein